MDELDYEKLGGLWELRYTTAKDVVRKSWGVSGRECGLTNGAGTWQLAALRRCMAAPATPPPPQLHPPHHVLVFLIEWPGGFLTCLTLFILSLQLPILEAEVAFTNPLLPTPVQIGPIYQRFTSPVDGAGKVWEPVSSMAVAWFACLGAHFLWCPHAC